MATRKKEYVPHEVVLHEETIVKAKEALKSNGLAHITEKAMWWLSVLTYRCTGHFKKKTSCFVSMNAKLYRNSFNKRSDYRKMVSVLVDAGVVERGRSHIAGVRSGEYRISPSLASGKSVLYAIEGRTADTVRRAEVKRREALIKTRGLHCPKAVYDSQVATLRRLSVELKAMERLERWTIKQEAKGKTIHASYEKSLYDIASMRNVLLMPDFILLREDAYGRLHSPITRLWEGNRQHLRLDGERLVGFDIKNSQPFFAGRFFERIAMALDNSAGAPLEKFEIRQFHQYIVDDLNASQDDCGMLLAYLEARLPEWSVRYSDEFKAELEQFRQVVKEGLLYERIVEADGLLFTPARAMPQRGA